jgi:hypothetical protein
VGVLRPPTVILAIASAGVAAFGGLEWRSGAATRSSSCTLAHQLGQQFVPDVYAQCQDAKRDVPLGIALLIAGVVVFALFFVPARTALRRLRDAQAAMAPPAGFMRFPRWWRPANARFMPVPPGWPQPPADWVPAEDWLPHPTWAGLPRGWPRPQRLSRGEVVRILVVAVGVSVLGIAELGLELAWPVTSAGWSPGGLLVVEVAAAFAARSGYTLWRRRSVQMPVWTAFMVAAAGYNYAAYQPIRWAGDLADGFALVAAVAFVLLVRDRHLWATNFRRVDRAAAPATGQPSGATGV